VPYDVAIVGAGPAGTATALSLLKAEPRLGGNILLIDKALHPREKICAGGLIPHTLDCLDELDVPLSIPHVTVDRAFVRVPPKRQVVCEDGGLCSIVRRNEFDFLLLRAAEERGAEVRQAEKLIDVVREAAGVRLITDKQTYRARVVVGADGSGSRVRRRLVGHETLPVGRAVMCDVPVADTGWDGFGQHRYDFNFLPVPHGLQGYLWAFPCLIGGVPHVNIGIYALGRTRLANAELRRLLGAEVAALTGRTDKLGDDDHLRKRSSPSLCQTAYRLRAFPICGYHPRRALAGRRVVLVGDAAGAEPLMGEGISFAFEYGKFAAQEIVSALRSRRVDFGGYTERLARSGVGKKLFRLAMTTRLFYGPAWRFWFGLAARSRRLQSVGLKWYNGVEGWHQRSGWEAVRAVLHTPSDLPSSRS
jgi:flavin-dependent dehydrogenase